MAFTHLDRAKTFLKGALHMFGNGLEELWKFTLTHKRAAGAVFGVLLIMIVAASFFLRSAEDDTQDTRREVALVRVGDLSGIEPLSLIGEVRSIREALVASDASGAVSGVYRSLGDVVGAGAVIAELKNDTERAAVSQARAALEKAKSTAGVGTIGVGSAESAYTTAEQSALSAIKTAYAAVEDAIKRKADQTISNPNSNQPRFFVSTSNSQLVFTVESGRLSMQSILTRHISESEPKNYEDYLSELNLLTEEVDAVGDFLSNVVAALSGAIPTGSVSASDIATYRTEANAALSSMHALRGTLSNTVGNLTAKRDAVESAKTGLALDTSGQSADIAAAEANLASALARLEKTIIRAPISGTINRLDLEVGSFVTASDPVVYITNPGGLEIVAYLSARDLGDIVVGAKVFIAGRVEGTVVKRAQALDPLTKKAEIRIAVPTNSGLVSGQSTTVSIERLVRRSEESALLSIPLAAVKITPEGPVVFTMSSENRLVAHPVILGTLRGSKVDITDGITLDMVIVEDARGLKEDQEVLAREK